jgi:hypothetical protein
MDKIAANTNYRVRSAVDQSETNDGGPNESALVPEVDPLRRRHTIDDLEDMHHDMGAVARPVNVSEEPGRRHASDTSHPIPVTASDTRVEHMGEVS